MSFGKGLGISLAVSLFASTAFAEIKVGFIGSLSSDTGLSTLRGAEMAIEDLNAKYGACMKDRTMLTIERDKLVKKVKELEKELNEMKEAQKKRKEEENEKKKKAKTITTTNGGSVASKIATRVKATEH